MTRRKFAAYAQFAAAVLILAPRTAEAHLVETGLGPVYDGVAHFALSPEYWVPIIGAAIYAGIGGKAAARRAIIVLPLTWLAGALLGGLTGAPILTAPTWLVLMLVGVFIAAQIPLPAWIRTLFAAALGFVLGYSNGLATAQFAHPSRATFGSAAAIFVVTSLTAAGASASSGWTRIVLRVAGSWIAASGLLALGWALR
jgi:urease accessory protein